MVNTHFYLLPLMKVIPCRRVKLLIDKLKRQKNKELQKENVPEDWCSKSDRGDIVFESSCSLEKIIASELTTKKS